MPRLNFSIVVVPQVVVASDRIGDGPPFQSRTRQCIYSIEQEQYGILRQELLTGAKTGTGSRVVEPQQNSY